MNDTRWYYSTWMYIHTHTYTDCSHTVLGWWVDTHTLQQGHISSINNMFWSYLKFLSSLYTDCTTSMAAILFSKLPKEATWRWCHSFLTEGWTWTHSIRYCTALYHQICMYVTIHGMIATLEWTPFVHRMILCLGWIEAYTVRFMGRSREGCAYAHWQRGRHWVHRRGTERIILLPFARHLPSAAATLVATEKCVNAYYHMYYLTHLQWFL
jgi:hypothetical protein